MRIWYRPWGWIYRPVSVPGALLILATLVFCATIVRAADLQAHSVSDFLYAVFPYIVSCLLALDWITSRTSGAPSPRAPDR